jgi:hypothetical protein
MKAIITIALLLAAACTTPDDAPDPVAQCEELVEHFCVAANACGWDANTGPCVDYYGPWCADNQTIVTPQTMRRSIRDLGQFECAHDETWITWPRPGGNAVLASMLDWAAEYPDE